MSEKVSVIIPVYNGEHYIERCLDSVIEQTYQDLEIIIVDDGSKDETQKICEYYKKQDDRIFVYRIANSGVSAARNYGLQKASGTYIQFVDVDDYLRRDATEVLWKKMKKEEADMVVCSYFRLIGHMTVPSDILELAGNYTVREYLCNTLRDPGHHYYGVVWNKLYRRDVIKKYHITFRTDVTLGEDFIFNLEYLQFIQKVSVILLHLYYYNNVNENSLSRQHGKDIENCRNELKNREKIYEYYTSVFRQNLLFDRYKGKIQDYWIKFYVRQVHFVKNLAFGWTDEEKKDWLKEVKENPYISRSLEESTKNHLNAMGRKYNVTTNVKLWMKSFM